MSENSSCLKQKEATWRCNLFIFFDACGKAVTVEQCTCVLSSQPLLYLYLCNCSGEAKGKEFEKLSQYLDNRSFVTQKVACTHQRTVGILCALLQLVRLILSVRILLVLAAIQKYIVPQKCEFKNRQVEK